jgi:hypothetical protein
MQIHVQRKDWIMSTAEQMRKARTLIQQKRFDDARALLITIDHPKADIWLNRLNQMGSGTAVSQPTSDKSFTVKLFVSIILLLFWIVPGLIALAIFAPEARKYPDAPGAGGLILLNRFAFALLLLAAVALVIFIVLPLLLS